MRRLSRRHFIAGATGAAAVGAGAVAFGQHPFAHAADARAVEGQPTQPTGQAATPAASPTGKGILVLVALYGGNDGLNTLVPYQDPAYLGGRPTLGLKSDETIPLDKDLALSASLKGLKGLWDQKQLAIVRGVGYPNPSYSHFRSMDIWQSAVPDRPEPTGWLGRWLDTLGGKDPLSAMAIGSTLPRALQGANTAGAAIPAGTVALPRGQQVEASFAAVETAYAGEPDLAARIAKSGTDLLTVVHAVRDIIGTSPAPTAQGTALSHQLDVVAQLIKGGLPTRVYMVSATGFDTHTIEKITHQRLLAELDAAVTTFLSTMATHPKGQGVVVMTMSEFGRRVAQNASGGTDHGSAAPLFVAGPSVKGGYYGEQPSLTDLDNGNLKFSTDVRSVYATVAAQVLGVDPKTVLMGGSFPTLPFV